MRFGRIRYIAEDMLNKLRDEEKVSIRNMSDEELIELNNAWGHSICHSYRINGYRAGQDNYSSYPADVSLKLLKTVREKLRNSLKWLNTLIFNYYFRFESTLSRVGTDERDKIPDWIRAKELRRTKQIVIRSFTRNYDVMVVPYKVPDMMDFTLYHIVAVRPRSNSGFPIDKWLSYEGWTFYWRKPGDVYRISILEDPTRLLSIYGSKYMKDRAKKERKLNERHQTP